LSKAGARVIILLGIRSEARPGLVVGGRLDVMIRRSLRDGSILVHFSVLLNLFITSGTATAQSMHGHPGGHHEQPQTNSVLYRPSPRPFYGNGGVPFLFGPPVFVPFPVGYYPPPVVQPILVGQPGGGLMLPNARQGWMAQPQPRTQTKSDPAKASGLMTVGDNLFRAANYRRAEWRYEQAVKANPYVAAPRVRLAQVALIRGDYQEAAEQIRAAMMAEPGWLVHASDIQALFPEPADFAKTLAKLESHLQGNPNDRDGWLVLGAEWYLSGRVRQSADVFARLNDRKPDATLAAFLDATTPDAPAR
jgi:hypothetical protein